MCVNTQVHYYTCASHTVDSRSGNMTQVNGVWSSANMDNMHVKIDFCFPRYINKLLHVESIHSYFTIN